MADEFSKIEGNGLLQSYQESGPAIEDALRKRRQRLAADKIGLLPEPGDADEE